MFQSLFQWILLANSKSKSGIELKRGFQSLFQWILLANGYWLPFLNQLLILQFQSLFQWILLANIVILITPAYGYVFQSLFQWILLANIRRYEHLPYRDKVSILVLVDLARELSIGSPYIGLEIGFNPCFSGSCSRIKYLVRNKSILRGFNPCFSGSCSRICDQERIRTERS